MNPPPNQPPTRKRTASTLSPPPQPPPSTNHPLVLHRHHHRRTIIANLPTTPTTSSTSTSTQPSPTFNIYTSLLTHPTLFYPLTLSLPLASALALYAIDKTFHYRFNLFSVSLLHAYAARHAPIASRVFSWVLHPEVCISDPMLRPMDGRAWLARDVPGWRWVGMVMWRQEVVRGILEEVGLEGEGWEEVVCKFWGVMEVGTTAMREAWVWDREVWRDVDIFRFQAFLVRLDVRLQDPVVGNGMCALSHLLLTQRRLGVLKDVLCGRVRLDYELTTELVVRTYLMEDLDADAVPWIDDEEDNGVPQEEWGLMMKEGWCVDGKRMESAVDMVIAESIRRELHVQQDLLDFVLHGYVDEDGKNLPIARRSRTEKKMVVREGWPGKGTRRKVIAHLNDRFGLLKNADSAGDAMDTGI